MVKIKIRILSGMIIYSIIIIILLGFFTFAIPEGPNSIESGPSERKTLTSGGSTQEAQAGNMTPLFLTSDTITKRWQGFYGNISGGILLDDANGNTLYSWGLTNPDGEVYASNSTPVTWANIKCVNFSTINRTEGYNLSHLNEFIGLASGSEQAEDDSINGTFNQTYTDSFQVGSVTIDSSDNCSMVTLYVNDAYQENNFKEVILSDNHSIVFTSILENDQTGFAGYPLDFQMIVGVNGTTEGTTRTYYFFAEIS